MNSVGVVTGSDADRRRSGRRRIPEASVASRRWSRRGGVIRGARDWSDVISDDIARGVEKQGTMLRSPQMTKKSAYGFANIPIGEIRSRREAVRRDLGIVR